MSMSMRQAVVTALWGIVLVMVGGTAWAGAATPNPGYLFDTRGDVVKNSYGECWKTQWWTPEYAIEECDPVAKPEPVVKRVTLDGKTYFDFDKATLRMDALDKLAMVVSEIKALSQLDSVVIVGHTDPVGSDAYNQKLSERRAESVKAFMVEHGVPAAVITAKGMGESELVVDCHGKRGKALNECNEPNRRVVIDISGMK